jgi:hypothetical protein
MESIPSTVTVIRRKCENVAWDGLWNYTITCMGLSTHHFSYPYEIPVTPKKTQTHATATK